MTQEVFERLESEVRSYCRSFPTVFTRASGDHLVDRDGKRYLDFFAGAGVLNYGHNHPALKQHLLDYLADDGLVHALDMYTEAKERFLHAFENNILAPRNLEYKLMFPGPTGTNAVESALKLARKVTGRHNVVAFTNGFHGMTLGALALTANSGKRAGAGVPLDHVDRMPFDRYYGPDVDTIELIERQLSDGSSGYERPAAFIVETVQGEGGVNVASFEWLERLSEVARRHDILLIIDDIQVGCGRTGPFFSFEESKIVPDMICLSKSLSGYGLPMSLALFRPELDQWAPGEHNGTFRGHNPAMVTATAALEHFWKSDALTQKVQRDARTVKEALTRIAERHGGMVRGRGLIQGLEFHRQDAADLVSKEAFNRGMVIETSGSDDQVLKLLPPLTIEPASLEQGLEILASSADAVLGGDGPTVVTPEPVERSA